MSEDLNKAAREIVTRLDKEKTESLAVEDQVLTPTDITEVEEELKKEEQFGDRGLETFGLGAASGVSFGLSDQLLTKLGIYTPEELREIYDRNEVADTAGQITGVAASLIPTGGASVAARGAAAAGKGVRAATKAGQSVEKLTAKGLEKIIAETGERKFAKEVIRKAIPQGAGSAVEGAAYGAGQLIREDALGTAEFNAENLVANLGGGALIGGSFGAGLGASLPLFGKVSKIGKISKDVAAKKLNDLTDQSSAAAELVGFSSSKISKLKTNYPKLLEELPDFLRNRLQLKKFTSTDELYEKAQQVKASAISNKPKFIQKIDEIAEQNPQAYLDKDLVFNPILQSIDDRLTDISGKASFRKEANELRKFRKDFVNEKFSGEPMSAAKLDELRKLADEKAKHAKFDNPTRLNLAARDVRRLLRQNIDDMADGVSKIDESASLLAKDLKQANQDIHIINTIEESLAKKSVKGEQFLNTSDLLLGGLGGYGFGPEALAVLGARKFAQSDLRRRLALTSFVEKQNQNMQTAIDKSLKAFFEGSKKPAIVAGKAAQASLVKSLIARKPTDQKGKEPKDEQAAFRAIRDNVKELVDNPEKLQKRAIMNTEGLAVIAPETASATATVLARAVTFLNSKLPPHLQNFDGLAALSRDQEVSDMELSKFRRYVQAIETPMALLDDLADGSATIDQVEAVKAVYPDIYSRIVDKTYEYIGSQKEQLPYAKRVQLGTLLGVPTDTSLRPDALDDLQANFGAREEQDQAGQQSTNAQGQAPGRLSVTGLREMDIAARENSQAQDFVRRRKQ
jgi:hypothetical protein